MKLKNYVETLPLLPGVYLFKDAQNAVIYIGKAKSLHKRVKSYFQRTDDWKIQSLLEEATTIEHIITATEIDAMLLEAELIGTHKPKFNVLLTSGQPFVYILFSKADLPTISIVRNKQAKGTYFGPFLHKSQARSVVQFLITTFQLKLCNKTIANGCLDYHLGSCAGNCMSNFDPQEYLFRVKLAQNVLGKDQETFLQAVTQRLQHHMQTLEFEKARILHGYINNLQTIFATVAANYSSDLYAHQTFHALLGKEYRIAPEQLAGYLQELVQAPEPIRTIDCFDISHFQSSFMVGASVRFRDGMPDLDHYRRFSIKGLSTQNDYAALREIVARRYRNPADIPDLIVIDGGKGQLNAVKDLLPEHKCVSLAKREELLFTWNHPEGIHLNPHDPAGKTIIALRDYAHHVARTYHVSKRNRQLPTKKALK